MNRPIFAFISMVTPLFPALMLVGCRQDAAASTQTVAPPVHVDTIEVTEASMPKSMILTGTLRGQKQTDLAANAMGRVMETFVERGSEVKKGDLIARLDVRSASLSAAEAKASVELAKAQRDTAQRECERYNKLRQRDAVSQLELDRANDQCLTTKLSVTSAEVRAQSASQVVGDGVIRAPFAGLIAERFVETGEYVRQDSKVVTLLEVDPLRLEFTVPEANLGQIKEGATITFTVPAYKERTFSAAVRFIGAMVRENTRDVVAEAEVPNPERALRSGMFATLELNVGENPTPVVPKTSLIPRDGRHHVFVVVGARLEERVVQTGAERGDVVGISRGLRLHEKVVTSPTNLHNGQAVN